MKKIYVIFSVLTLVATTSAMAVDNGCSKEDNTYINPVVALCSTHAYNIASEINNGHNFSSDTDRQNQRDIIALKTTVITQQMKQQYDYLNSTIKRLKTQLQKAVLTTSLEAAGASSESGSSSYNSNNRNIILAGAQDCSAQTSTNAVLDCMQSNIVQIRAAVNANNLSEAFKQLQRELTVANGWDVFKEAEYKADKNCSDVVNNTRKRETLLGCIDTLSMKIVRKRDESSNANVQLNALKGIFGNN